MTEYEERAMRFVAAIVKPEDHPGCWFCQRGKLIGQHHHFGDGCPLPDVPASPSWATPVEKAS